MTRKQRIADILSQHLNSTRLEVIDESHRHHVPEGLESHINILIVSEEFQTLSRIERHRLINKLLAAEFNNGLHALSLNLHTPAEWQTAQEQPLTTPTCRNGYRHG